MKMEGEFTYFRLPLDQITAENDGNDDHNDEDENIQLFSGVLKQTSDASELKYYAVHDNQFDINQPSSNIEIMKVTSKNLQSNFLQINQCGIFQDLQKSIQEFDESHLIHKHNNEISTVIHIVGLSNEVKKESENELHQLLEDGNVFTEYIETDKEVKTEEATIKKDRVWNCEHCPDLVFLSRASHQRHRSRQHKPLPKNYPCTECELSFPLARRLKSHMLSEHQHYRPHKCVMCSRKFSKLSDMKKHVKNQHEVLNLSTRNSQLQHDQAGIDVYKPTQELKCYPCTQCKISFLFPSRLKNHLLTVHQNYRPHKCPTCKKSFSKLSDVKKHINVHTQRKTYACTTCRRQFSDASNLERHRLTHIKVKPHECPVCGKKYTQLSSLRKHRTDSTAAILGKCGELKTSGIVQGRYYCRICDCSFNDERLLREHSESHESKQNVSNLGRSVDALIQDILQEDKHDGIERLQNENIREPDHNYDPTETALQESISDYYEIKLINEIDRLEHLRENFSQSELSQTDLFASNIDSMENISHYIQLRDNGNEKNLNTRNNDITQELISNSDTAIKTSVVEQNEECATIFESDVDLESSANLTANLNQLIAGNNVEFVSTEHDDTFIINLDTSMDAKQLSNLLNIGIEVVKENYNGTRKQNTNKNVLKRTATNRVPEYKKLRCKSFRCKHCSKAFNKKENYVSHMGNHDPMLCRHQCHVCSKKFGYRSTLNKHMKNAHTPVVWTTHKCHLCGDMFKHKWMLKDHKNSKHRKIQPFRCELESCRKQFHKRSDFLYHTRQHTGERPYKCSVCGKRFVHASHRAKHQRRCLMRGSGIKADSRTPVIRSNIDKELLSDIEDLLRSKIDDS